MTNKTAVATRIDIYDPAMCCSTGVCGPDVDDSLTDFASDVKWMKSQGMEVNRFNLGQEPEAFKLNPEVLSRLKSAGSEILPIIIVNGEMVSEGGYPDRQQLMEWVLGSPNQSQNGVVQSSHEADQIVKGLEAAVTGGNQIQIRALFHQGESSGVSIEEMVKAMQAGINNRQRITQSTLQTANELLGVQPGGCTPGGGCC